MVAGVDYTVGPSSSAGGRTELTLDLLIDPDMDPRLFFRVGFTDTAP